MSLFTGRLCLQKNSSNETKNLEHFVRRLVVNKITSLLFLFPLYLGTRGHAIYEIFNELNKGKLIENE